MLFTGMLDHMLVVNLGPRPQQWRNLVPFMIQFTGTALISHIPGHSCFLSFNRPGYRRELWPERVSLTAGAALILCCSWLIFPNDNKLMSSFGYK